MHTQEIQTKRKPNYVGVFFILAFLTAIELGVTRLPVPKIPVLIPLALAKAALVALFYMHLRFDRRVFSAVFAMGVLMGIGLIISLTILFAPQLVDLK